uniref:Putative glycosyl hydrolase family5 n=1 Tax=uncultured symbiotic protist of Mastotermes darwiniensis TaxID=403661 RepID=A4UX03_9EUKA|nr:putative glycosyl hydrolase family5 [uncultured symbiotic protist of Mastotermes darwiniensis]
MFALFAALTFASTKTDKCRGVSCSWHNWWPQFHTAKTVDGLISDFHANVVRTFIGVEKEKGYLTNKQNALTCCYNVIDECISKGIFGIINWASFQTTYLTQATEFFTTMAKKYAGNAKVIYELLNEPESATWAQIKTYSESLIKTIRQYDKTNLILVPTPSWDQKIGEAAKDPVTIDTNLAYTFHIYTATHPKSYQDDLKAAVGKISVWADENGAMNSDGKGALDTAGWNNWISLYEQLGVNWLCYGTQDTSETCSLFKSTDSFSDLSAWGTLCKSTIRKYQ